MTSAPDNAGKDLQWAGKDTPWSAAEMSQVTVYTPQSPLRAPGVLARQMAIDLVAGRGLAWRLFSRNLRGIYRQTLLGVLWIFLPSVAGAAIWVFLFSQNVVRFPGELPAPYPVFVLTGLILWQAFIEAFQMPLEVVRSNRNMLGKLKFPREALLLAGLAEVLFNLCIRLALIVAILFIFQVPLQWTILAAPLTVLALLILATALGLLLMPIGTLYHDVGRLIAIGAPIWMILTPIIYPPPEGGAASLLNWLNPASPLVIASRDFILAGGTEHGWSAAVYALLAGPLLLAGLVLYRVSMPILIERSGS